MLMRRLLHSHVVVLAILHLRRLQRRACPFFALDIFLAFFFILVHAVFYCVRSRIALLFAFHVEIISAEVHGCILSHARICFDSDVHLVRGQFPVLARQLLLIGEALAVGAVETVLQVVRLAADVVLHHAPIFLFELA